MQYRASACWYSLDRCEPPWQPKKQSLLWICDDRGSRVDDRLISRARKSHDVRIWLKVHDAKLSRGVCRCSVHITRRDNLDSDAWHGNTAVIDNGADRNDCEKERQKRLFQCGIGPPVPNVIPGTVKRPIVTSLGKIE